MKILITGGAGFIGSHVAQFYFDNGNEVYVLDNLSTGFRDNIKFIKDDYFFKEDVQNKDAIKEILIEYDFEVIIHLAAVVSVVETINEPVNSNEINIDSTLNILNVLKRYNLNIRRFVFASSAAVYGNNLELPNKTGVAVNPQSPYAIQKFAGEQYSKIFHTLYDLPTVSLRFFNVYGPKQDPKSPYSGVLSIMRDKYINNEVFTFYGDGTQTRDFVYVKDIVQAIDIVINNQNAIGGIYNVGTGKPTSLIEIFKTYEKLYELQIDFRKTNEREGDIKHSYADINDLISLGYKPNYDLDIGLLNYYKFSKQEVH
ncbi:NAD-dependent epimerase/dehydratase family protein [Staphylococcus pseudoxylosus]|uniref:NAD-dependent epimerase/dehydratase family protein n=1 Tax=Staphylococcus pseudoxylosus TaxID=2282419 RepID=A0AAQ0S652_9STAP|nr:NAD-dependent epimerase/dehydratase family protein [Staphylococcus pseudoxylosus]MCE5001249.1 NAD-dependent epimerase/dehydratase family protein [Staphylococcus pseudoxylosus]RMI84463.1 NAD-dependent epimerase/dehydratase family protein [Staphylococcus pseudoxylosus]